MKGKMNMCLFFFYSLLYLILCAYVLGIGEEELKERPQGLNDKNNDNYNNNSKDLMSFANEVVRFMENEKDVEEDKNVNIISGPVENTLNRYTGSSFLNIKKYGRKGEYLNRSSFFQRSYVNGCQEKRKSHTWVCGNEGNDNICIPDRRVQLCITSLQDIKNSGSEKNDRELLKNKVFDSAMYEADLLWNKYGFRGFDDFCDDVKNSYLDYKDVIFGTDLDKNNISKIVEEALKRFFKKDSSILNPHAWWKKYGTRLWKYMIKPYEHLGCKRPNEGEPQINRWLKEWGKYNCKLLKEKEKSLIKECAVNKRKTDCSRKCNNECYTYRNFINRQKYEINKLGKNYVKVIRYNIFNRKIIPPNNALDFIKLNCSECKNVNFKTLFEFEYGKYEEKCMCQSYIDLKIQFKNHGICLFNAQTDTVSSDKRFCVEKKESKPWQCDKNSFEKVHAEGVCVSPRRQAFCLGNLSYLLSDDIYKVHNSQLLIEILMASKQEGKFLWKKHGITFYNNYACKYINDSYADYKDIVIGTDLWNDKNSIKAQNNLNAIFERNFGYKVGRNKLFKTVKDLRTVWWILNRDNIWESMKCGIIDVDPRGYSCVRMNELENMPQFFRWFSQWAHFFCKEKEYWELKLNDKCKDTKGNSLCKEKTCQNVCTDMNYWTYTRKLAYEIQSLKYNKERNLYSFSKDKNVSIFLKENTKNCYNIDFTKIFYQLDKLFKERCPCMDTKRLEVKNKEMLSIEANSEEEEELQGNNNSVSVISGNKGTNSDTKVIVKDKNEKQREKEAKQTTGSLTVQTNEDSDSKKGKSTATDTKNSFEKLEVQKDATNGETIKEEHPELPQSPENSQTQEQEKSESDQPRTGRETSEQNEISSGQEQNEPSSSTEVVSQETTSENASPQDTEKLSTEPKDNSVVVNKETSSNNLAHEMVDEEQDKHPNTNIGKDVSLKTDKQEEQDAISPLQSTVSSTESAEPKVQSTPSTDSPTVEGENAESLRSPHVADNSESESGLNSTDDFKTTKDVVKEQETLKGGESVSETLENSSEKPKDVDPSHEISESVPSGTTDKEEKDQLEGKSLEMENGTYPGSNDEEDVTGPSVEDITNDDNNSFHNIANQSDVLNREDAIASETQVESEPEDSNRVITTEVPSTTVTTTDEKLSEEVEEKEAEEIKEPVESRVIRETMENSANLDSPAHEEDVEKETLEPEKNELYNDTSRGNISEKDLNDIQSLRTETDSTVLDDSSENGEKTEDSESEVGILRKHNFSTEQNEEKDFDPVESDLEKEEIKNLLNLEKEEDADVEIIDRTHDSMSDGDNSDSNNNNLSSEEKIEQYKNRDVSKEREEILNMSKTNICSNEHSLKYCQFMERNKDLLETCSLENRLHLCCAISDYCLKYFNPNSLEYFNCTQNEFDDPTYNCFRKQRFTSMHYIAGGGIIALLLFILGSASYRKNLNDENGFYDSNVNDSAFEYNNNKYNKLPYMFDQQINVVNSDLYSEGIYDDTTTF
ncbi:erythrocyte binding antigen-181 [Plasmodium reichenowi]|uniref:Erythrocyte binding antigen-181 n=1 Tax=Plasmodium reichenowi TaxID=5854 RepID=A0A2P9D1R2_PLARE|nr:erythrocyte binding antigen-181 [Plasmodium reichenowi]